MNRIALTFTDGPRVQIDGNVNKMYDVSFVDEDSGIIVYSTRIATGSWAQANLKYYVKWHVTVLDGSKRVIDHHFDLSGKKAFVHITSRALGDNIAWIPYVEEFRKERNCEVHVSTNWNHIFEKAYPDLVFIEPNTDLDLSGYHAAYRLGVFDNDYQRNRNNWRFIPLQQVASDGLGLPFYQIRSKIAVPEAPRPIQEKYVAIAEFSTFAAKHWNYPNGWQKIVDWLNDSGLKVVSVSKEETQLSNVIKMNGRPIDETINTIRHAEFFVGVASGLSWVAWALEKTPVIISGFTDPISEMTDCVRVINRDVCHGCYNDQHVVFDRGNWRLCPKNRNMECSAKITPEMVQRAVSKLIQPNERFFYFDGLKVNTNERRKEMDWLVAEEVISRDSYHINDIENEPRVVIDVGGHIGTFGLKIKSRWPNVKLIAFEPNTESYELYRKNMEDNGFTNWFVENAAIEYDANKSFLADDCNCTGGGILVKDGDLAPDGRLCALGLNGGARYAVAYSNVKTLTLEEVFEKYAVTRCDLLKLDCESSEIGIIREMSHDIANAIGRIMGEYHCITYEEFAKLLESRGFSAIRTRAYRMTQGVFDAYSMGGANAILYIAPHCSTGGMPQYLLWSIANKMSEGNRVEVIEYSNVDNDVFSIQKNKIKKLCGFHSLNGNKLDSIRQIVDRVKPGTVHLQEFPEIFLDDDVADYLYRADREYEIVETTHGENVLGAYQKLTIPDRFEFVTHYHADKFKDLGVPINVVEYTLEKKNRPDRTVALKKLGLDPKVFHVLNVGLFAPWKNQAEVFDVARKLPEVQFHFIGNQAGNFADYWGPLLEQKPDNCHIWGERDDVDDFYAAMDLLYFGSTWECNPLVPKEAISWDMPVLLRNLPIYGDAYQNNSLVTMLPSDLDKTCSVIMEMLRC